MCLKLVYDKIFSRISYGRSSKLIWLELLWPKLTTLKFFSGFVITTTLVEEPELLLLCCLVDTILDNYDVFLSRKYLTNLVVYVQSNLKHINKKNNKDLINYLKAEVYIRLSIQCFSSN